MAQKIGASAFRAGAPCFRSGSAVCHVEQGIELLAACHQGIKAAAFADLTVFQNENFIIFPQQRLLEPVRNLFFTKASLHDGAVIIRNDRIAAAGCVLPLTENHNISSDLGTRHRAGIGISEVSDAVVVIVSEETGTISVAISGMLKRHLAPQTLEKLLLNELAPQREEKTRNPLKLLRRKQKENKDAKK